MNFQLAKQLGDRDLFPHQLDRDYPSIAQHIAEYWNTPQIEHYLSDLLFDKRGNRHGFSPEILAEIFALQNHYRSLLPPKPITIDNWADAVSYGRHGVA